MKNKQKVFEHAASMRVFLTTNQPAEDWVNDAWIEYGLRGPVDRSRISRALNGVPVAEEIVDALEGLHSHISRDPMAWLILPTDLDSLTEFASLAWWHTVLDPEVPLASWNCMKGQPLSAQRAEDATMALLAFNERTAEVCADHKQDHDLLAAFWAEQSPVHELWCVGENTWRHGDKKAPTEWEPQQIRVAPFGMHNVLKNAFDNGADSVRLAELAARAHALQFIDMSLPNLATSKLSYDVELTDADHAWGQDVADAAIKSNFADYQEPGPWNGHAFDYVQEWDRRRRIVRYTWTDGTYVPHMIDDLHQVHDLGRYGSPKAADWRAPTQDERDFHDTGVKRTPPKDPNENKSEIVKNRGQEAFEQIVKKTQAENTKTRMIEDNLIARLRREGKRLNIDGREEPHDVQP